MATFIRLFFTLLFPLSILSIILSMLYFMMDYDASKAMKLGVLSGILMSIPLSFVLATALLILRKVSPNQQTDIEQSKEQSKEKIKEETKVQTKEVETKVSEPAPIDTIKGITQESTCMLLMDRELAFEILMNFLKKIKHSTISLNDPQRGIITIQNKEGIIQTNITALTKHTSEIILRTQNNATHAEKLIHALKEKEHSLLQY
ncbi:MAG: hypothetical protein U9O64_00435 [Campylobacterota bacterium]|nr:hypothetical protein [Campylobacterota bacterium]